MSSLYREYPPSSALAPIVECYWSRVSAKNEGPPETHRVLPDGCLDIVFNFGHARTNSAPSASGGAAVRQGGAVIGTMTAPLLVTPGAREDFLGVRFRPGRARAVLRASASEFTDAAVPLGDIWGAEGRRLEERLAAAQDARSRISVLEGELVRRLPDAPLGDPCVSAAIDLISRHRGAATVRDACRSGGVTRQHLARRFAEHVGIPPKLFSRVVRFQCLLVRLRASGGVSWSDVAADSGYYDQSHLIADFREFAGSTPEQFVASRAS
ncbi:MAG: DUF6597 domain-containing transcriptional factor [Candidatus Acidiferrales bacterium]